MRQEYDNDIIVKLRERYGDLHPLLFHVSCDRSKSLSDLFDILDSVEGLPVQWDGERWKNVNIH